MPSHYDTSVALDQNGKAVLDHVYNLSDPRSYFSALHSLDYRIPDAAQPLIKGLLAALARHQPGKTLKLIDLACSYGVTGRLLRSGLSMAGLSAHYQAHKDLTLDTLITTDRMLDSAAPNVSIVGQDVAEKACAYAHKSQAVDATIVANLETQTLTEEQTNLIADADLIVSTGFIGYGGMQTIARILDAAVDRQPWMVHFVMRPFDYAPIRRALATRGYVTAQGTRPVFQRKFASYAEKEKLIGGLLVEGTDPTGFEEGKGIHAELYISRPARERGLISNEEFADLLQTQ